jgi:hypothetical protein
MGMSKYFLVTVIRESSLRMFEKRLLRRIYGPKMDELTVERRKLHNEELNGLCSSPSIIRVIKSRRIRWAGPAARMGKEEVYTGFWWGNLREKDHLEDQSVDGKIILICTFRKWRDVGHRLDRSGSG